MSPPAGRAGESTIGVDAAAGRPRPGGAGGARRSPAGAPRARGSPAETIRGHEGGAVCSTMPMPAGDPERPQHGQGPEADRGEPADRGPTSWSSHREPDCGSVVSKIASFSTCRLLRRIPLAELLDEQVHVAFLVPPTTRMSAGSVALSRLRGKPSAAIAASVREGGEHAVEKWGWRREQGRSRASAPGSRKSNQRRDRQDHPPPLVAAAACSSRPMRSVGPPTASSVVKRARRGARARPRSPPPGRAGAPGPPGPAARPGGRRRRRRAARGGRMVAVPSLATTLPL
jgi:hypothetical protein